MLSNVIKVLQNDYHIPIKSISRYPFNTSPHILTFNITLSDSFNILTLSIPTTLMTPQSLFISTFINALQSEYPEIFI